MSGPREPAPLAPPELDGDDAGEPSTDEATPLPPAVPYHIADPTSWSLERRFAPDAEPPVLADDDTTIPEQLRSMRLAELAGGDADPALATLTERAFDVEADGDADVDVDVEASAEDEQTRPRVRFPTGESKPTPRR